MMADRTTTRLAFGFASLIAVCAGCGQGRGRIVLDAQSGASPANQIEVDALDGSSVTSQADAAANDDPGQRHRQIDRFRISGSAGGKGDAGERAQVPVPLASQRAPSPGHEPNAATPSARNDGDLDKDAGTSEAADAGVAADATSASGAAADTSAQPDAGTASNPDAAATGTDANTADTAAPPSASPCAANSPSPPIPQQQCAVPATKLFNSNETVPPASLVVEIGTIQEGVFMPWKDGTAVAMTHGFQGGLHVAAYARIHRSDNMPIQAGPLKLESVGAVNCNVVTAQKVLPMKSVASTSLPGGIVAPPIGGMWMILPAAASEAAAWCGVWFRATVRARLATGAFGEASVMLRLIDP